MDSDLIKNKSGSKSGTLPSSLNSFNPVSYILNPWFVTGYTEGDGTFYFGLTKRANSLRWEPSIGYSIVAATNPANYELLLSVQEFFGLGKIRFAADQSYMRF